MNFQNVLILQQLNQTLSNFFYLIDINARFILSLSEKILLLLSASNFKKYVKNDDFSNFFLVFSHISIDIKFLLSLYCRASQKL